MYTAEQQTHIDGLVKDAYARAYDKAHKVLAEASEAKLEPIKARLAEAYDRLRVMAITSAAAEHGAVDASQVAALMDGSIKIDDSGSLFVVDTDGQRRYSPDGAPLTVKDAVEDFLDDNLHMVKRLPSTGVGTSNHDLFVLD